MNQVAKQKSVNLMIEFKGKYCQRANEKSVVVLVQFDGVLLHVWHLPDPFYRILSSDAFQVAASFTRGQRCIKLSNGDRILTNDAPALDSLAQCHSGGGISNPSLLKPTWVIAAISSISIVLAAWWLSNHGLPF